MHEVFSRATIVENPNQNITPQFIESEISLARDRLLREWDNGGRELKAFEPEFDRVCYVTLFKYKDVAPNAYRQVKDHLDSHTTLNLQTTVGERLNAALSTWEYDIKEDGIYTQGSNERAIEVFRRGWKMKRKRGNEVDFAREDAELVGFYKTEKEIADSMTFDQKTGEEKVGIEDGTFWVSFSHRGDVKNGSSYPHNFCDTHTVKTRNGKKYIESKRFAIALSPSESFLKTKKFFDYPDDFEPTPEYFLSHPIRISNHPEIKDAESFHKYLHENIAGTLSESQMDRVLRRIQPAIDDYLTSLEKNPFDISLQLEGLRGVLNSADESAVLIKNVIEDESSNVIQLMPMTEQELSSHKSSEVKTASGGCGKTGEYGGKGKRMGGAFSVADYGKKDWEYHKGDCVVCKTRYTMVGPCKICTECEKKFDEEEYAPQAA